MDVGERKEGMNDSLDSRLKYSDRMPWSWDQTFIVRDFIMWEKSDRSMINN